MPSSGQSGSYSGGDVFRWKPGDDTFNVKAYGATGNGTTDDTAAIQATIDAAAVNGGVVFYPPGIYTTDASLSLPNGVYHQGSGRGVSIIKAAAGMTTPVFSETVAAGGTTEHWGLSDLTIDGTAGPTGTVDGISLNTAADINIVYRDILVERVSFRNCRAGWLHAANNFNGGAMQNETYVVHSTFYDCYMGAVVGGSYCSTFADCFSYGCTEAGLATQDFANFTVGGSGPTTFMRVAGFHVEGLGNLTGSGTATDNGIECVCSESGFTDLALVNISRRPLAVHTSEAEDNDISNVRIWGSGWPGIVVTTLSAIGADYGGRISNVVMVDVAQSYVATLRSALENEERASAAQDPVTPQKPKKSKNSHKVEAGDSGSKKGSAGPKRRSTRKINLNRK
jgi:hypothetical protein